MAIRTTHFTVGIEPTTTWGMLDNTDHATPSNPNHLQIKPPEKPILVS